MLEISCPSDKSAGSTNSVPVYQFLDVFGRNMDSFSLHNSLYLQYNYLIAVCSFEPAYIYLFIHVSMQTIEGE
jgi:hypothetical protein